MFVVQVCYHHCEHIVCPGEIQSIHLSKRNKNCRILVHPLIAQCLVFCNFQSRKQLSAVFADVKEVFQHTHTQNLTESTGTSNECHLRFFLQNLRNQAGFINITKPTIPNLLKVRNSNRNIHFFHLCRALLVAMHGLFIVSMIP